MANFAGTCTSDNKGLLLLLPLLLLLLEYAANSDVGEIGGAAKPRARGAKPVTLFLLNEI